MCRRAVARIRQGGIRAAAAVECEIGARPNTSGGLHFPGISFVYSRATPVGDVPLVRTRERAARLLQNSCRDII